MNILDLLRQKLRQLNICTHPKFLEEFENLITNSGREEEIVLKFISYLEAAESLGVDMCMHSKIEHLTGKKNNNLYSLHINTSDHNYRVLFSIDNSNKLLLHTFFEKQGKNKTNYESHVPIAIQRRNEFQTLNNRRK